MSIQLSKKAAKSLKNINEPEKTRIKNAIKGIPNGDIKKLQGSNNQYRLRLGDWRIVFSYINEEIILIEKIAPRGQVYRGIN